MFLCHSVASFEARADKKPQFGAAADERVIAAEASIGWLCITFVSLDECAINVERQT